MILYNMGFDLKFIDNSSLVLSQLDNAVGLALEEIGLRAEGHAIGNAPVGTPESTGVHHYKGGSLKNSITHKVVGNTVFVGTNIKSRAGFPYGIAVELGTGIYATDGSGRKSPWAWQDENGDWHMTKGRKPTHFLRNAITKHRKEYINAIRNKLKGK